MRRWMKCNGRAMLGWWRVAWKAITTLTGNPGTLDWTVPPAKASKANCKVRVILQDAAGSLGKDDSNLKFTIHP